MDKRFLRKYLGLVLVGVVSLFSVLANAADENFDVYVLADVKYDDNVFRFADDAEAIAQTGSSTQDDVETTIGVGANVIIPVSRQSFNVDAELRRTKFDRFGELDNTNGEFTGEWEWAYASRASGTLGYNYERELTDFFEFQEARRDTVVDQDFYGSARIPVHPRWTVVVGGKARNVDYDEQPRLDKDTSTVFGELLFETRVKTFVGVSLRESDTEFDNNVGVDNDFSETEFNAVVRWDATGKSRFSGSFGRTNRDENDEASGDFSGGTGRAEYRRIVSGKTLIDFELFRDTDSVDDVASLVVAKGVAIRPEWKISPKLTFRGGLEYEERDFEGTEVVVGGSGREDELLTLRARLSYKLNRALTLNFGLGHESRDSNDPDSEFDQTELSAGLRFNI